MEKNKKKKNAKLKNILHVKTFRNDWEELQLNLMFTYHWMQKKLKEIHQKLEVTPQQFQVLRIIGLNKPDPVTIEEIKSKIIEIDADMSRMIQRLLQQQLITKEVKRTDRRASEITLTALGEELLQAGETLSKESDQIFHTLSKKEAKAINKLLTQLRS
jgi:DNA-binding MarR family transcriptional regulator